MSKTKPQTPPTARSRAHWIAPTIAAMVGVPVLALLVIALVDGHHRSAEAPYRILLGEDAFMAFKNKKNHPIHYMGSDRTVPSFSLTDPAGSPWRSSALQGKAIVLNFWTKTCKPCVEEMPSLLELAQRVEPLEDVQVLAVSTDQDWASVRNVFGKGDRPPRALQILFDPERKVVKELFGTRLYPETWFIDKNGTIRLRIDGPRDWTSPVVLDLIEDLRG